MLNINALSRTLEKYGSWDEKSKGLVRLCLADLPTGRMSYYSLSKCFDRKEHSVEEVVSALQDIRVYDARMSEYEDYEIEYAVSNVVTHKGRMHCSFSQGQVVEFWHGTSLARAKAFIKRGGGFTRLERTVCDEGRVTDCGIQVMLEDFRAEQYAERQAYPLRDKGAVLHGWIPAEYLFPENNENEYSIPWFRYKDIIRPEISEFRVFFYD